MKNIILTLALLPLLSVSVLAHEPQNKCCENCKHPPYTNFKVVHPADLLRGFGCYCKETAEKTADGVGTVFKGTGEIISAPFKSRMRFPQARNYRWYRGHWHEGKPEPHRSPPHMQRGTPPRHRGHHPNPDDLKPPKVDLGRPATPEEIKKMQFIPAPTYKHIDEGFVLFERKF